MQDEMNDLQEVYTDPNPGDLVRVVRCRYCKWKNQHNCTRAVEVWIDDDKFCAWAEMEGAEDDA